MTDKKISPANDADEKNTEQNNHAQDSTGGKTFQGAIVNNAPMTDAPAQILENLPQEILDQPRFFPVGANKVPQDKGWSNPDNQKHYTEIKGYVGFDTAGHDRAVDYLFLDFDHIFTDAGQFVNVLAEDWFNMVVDALKTYCELSASLKGAHVIAVPTAGKFPKVASGKNGRIYFDDEKKSFVEIFYGTGGRYCFFTGNVYRCEPKAPVAHGQPVDDVFKTLLDEVATQNKKPQKSTQQKPTAPPVYQSTNSPDFDIYRAEKMLEVIRVADLSREDWLNVGMALKNNGNTCADWEQWSRPDERFKDGECDRLWQGFNGAGLTIATIHNLAKQYGYSEKDTQRKWYQLHPDKKPSVKRTMDNDLKQELDDAIIWLDTLTPDEFTAEDATNRQNIRAVALATNFGYSTKAEKFFYIIKDARKNAKIRLADAKSNLTEPLSEKEKKELQALIDLNINRLKYYIKIQVDIIKSQHADFLQQEHERKVEYAKAMRKEEVSQNLSSLDDLIKTYRANPTRELANKIREIIFNACEGRFSKGGDFLGIKATAANAKIIFSYDPVIDGLIGYDEFKQADVFLKVAPWKYEQGTPLDKQPCIRQEWRDSDDAELRKYLRETYTEFASKQLISDYTTSYSNKNRFHVVKEFFKNLPLWDGQPRAETLFIKFLRVEDSPFAREVTLNWLTAAVARIFHPGCRYQTALVLHGAQGIGKGYTLEQLGGEWYGALVDNVDDPHAIDTIKSLWIVEIPEMSAMRKAEVNAIKSFISRSEDTRRFAYERRAARVQRHCVFAITVNDDQFLIDPTGNRRYLILHCNSARLDYVEGLTDDYIKQVWAEVYCRYNKLFKNGFDEKKLELSKSAQIQAEEIASRYMKDDGLQGEIKAFVDTKIPPLPIWNLLSRDERRKFFAQGFITLLDGQADLNKRARGRFGRNAQKYVDELDKIFNRQDTVVRKTSIKRGNDTLEEFHIYGSELRQHICAAEIFTECFGQDNRKKIHRVHEVLAELDGWTQGNRVQKDFAYGDQKTIYYRDTEKLSAE